MTNSGYAVDISLGRRLAVSKDISRPRPKNILRSFLQHHHTIIMRTKSASTLFILARLAFASPFLKQTGHGEPTTPGTPEFYEKVVISSVLVVVGGIFAG
jgi:hypothetical protein